MLEKGWLAAARRGTMAHSRQGAGMSQLWLIEGIPGSGKTSAAEQLSALSNSRGAAARWWLEEAKDHPVLPSRLRKLSATADFSERCVEAFRSFISVETGILILEGAAFQSTVRFMFANAKPYDEIADYVGAWTEAVTPARPRLLMFRVADPISHYTRFVAEMRGEPWIEKLVAYVEATPIAQDRSWMGLEGFIQFWAAYQELCFECAATLPWPVKIVDAWSESRSFDALSALDFFRG